MQAELMQLQKDQRKLQTRLFQPTRKPMVHTHSAESWRIFYSPCLLRSEGNSTNEILREALSEDSQSLEVVCRPHCLRQDESTSAATVSSQSRDAER